MTLNVKEYWARQYTVEAGHHSRQCAAITRSFLEIIRKREKRGHPEMTEALRTSRIIEVGCGTGELANKIRTAFKPPVIVGTDLSPVAVERAQKRFPHTEYRVWDVLDPVASISGYTLALCSNTLEHFAQPWVPLQRMLDLCGQALILVPYDQPVVDGYDEEGGAGHAARFTLDSFAEYDVVDRAIFASPGWQYLSPTGEPALQLAVLLR